MLTYQNDAAVKAEFQKRFADHRLADEVIQGTGFNVEEQRGCFIGCTMNEYSHESFAEQIGPQWLAHLADKIFEGLDADDAPQFGTDLLEAIPVGKDIDSVQWLLAIARHTRQLTRLEGNTEPYADQCRAALQKVIDYCQGMADKQFSAEAARSARSAARSAAESAESAESAAWSAARSAESAAESARSARSAARSAESAAWSAAWSAARSAAESAWSAARSAAESAWSAARNEYEIERDTLLSLLRGI